MLTLVGQSTIVYFMGRTSDAKQQLLNSALELIYAKSYADVSIQDICEHAGVKKGSFHYFFPTKRDLELAALDQQWELAKTAVLERAFSPDIPPLQRIETYVRLIYEYQLSVKNSTGKVQGCHFGNLACELGTQDEFIREKVDQIFQKTSSYIEGAVHDAVLAGDLAEVDPKATALAILGYLEGLLLIAKSKNNPEIIKELGKLAVNLTVPSKLPSNKKKEE